jgi:hypothetical protein
MEIGYQSVRGLSPLWELTSSDITLRWRWLCTWSFFQQILQPFKLIEKFLDEGENAQSITSTGTSIILRSPQFWGSSWRRRGRIEMNRANTSRRVTREQNFLRSKKYYWRAGTCSYGLVKCYQMRHFPQENRSAGIKRLPKKGVIILYIYIYINPVVFTPAVRTTTHRYTQKLN